MQSRHVSTHSQFYILGKLKLEEGKILKLAFYQWEVGNQVSVLNSVAVPKERIPKV